MVFAKFLYKAAHFLYLLRVKAACRLVEYEHRRVADERLREADALAVALGKVAYEPAAHLGGFSYRAYLVKVLFLRQRYLFKLVDEVKVLVNGHVLIKRRDLRHIAYEFFSLNRFVERVVAADVHASAARGNVPGYYIHGR